LVQKGGTNAVPHEHSSTFKIWLLRRSQRYGVNDHLGNFLRTLTTPEPIKDWSLTNRKDIGLPVGQANLRSQPATSSVLDLRVTMPCPEPMERQ
jgi:hypothetical protein